MPAAHRYTEVDVFTSTPLLGNPVAVVHDADDLSDAQLAAFARWTNLSETTFLLRPTRPGADYRVRIFTPGGELPFAGHPTLGTCHAWLGAGGLPVDGDTITQDCTVGPVTIRRTGDRLAFAAPPLRQDRPLEDAELASALDVLGLPADAVVDHRLLDNGPAWPVLLLDAADRVLELRPDWSRAAPGKLGVVAPRPAGGRTAFEMRAFAPGIGIQEDPVTGSLNASVGEWLTRTGRAPAAYVAAQGTAVGRAGRVHVEREDSGRIWVGGATVTVVEGTVRL
ncbi:PhzF family phenazine biosynthesis protein [Cellulomonas alba]|uniref:PhzF family phenazine biosynthesis protein n=1 Tax=Cellulomonas alba TaxID=3053467 RepID=A0ABT7SIL7_9CELL|nr:PhzF family phenazine biosynthesis protein [Cellulomonas alba]MDM7856030.1 PhzF family phenazine biosynthesis protein [Cellulomonas alba]